MWRMRANTSATGCFKQALLSVSAPSAKSTKRAHSWAMPTTAVAVSVATLGMASAGSPGM